MRKFVTTLVAGAFVYWCYLWYKINKEGLQYFVREAESMRETTEAHLALVHTMATDNGYVFVEEEEVEYGPQDSLINDQTRENKSARPPHATH